MSFLVLNQEASKWKSSTLTLLSPSGQFDPIQCLMSVVFRESTNIKYLTLKLGKQYSF